MLSVVFDSKHQGWIKVLVSSGSGVFENEKTDVWSDFLGLLSFRGVTVEKIPTRDSTKQRWCPSYSSSVAKISHEHVRPNPGMVVANTKLEMKLNDFTHNQIDIFKPSVDSDNTEHIHSELNLPFWSQCEHHLLPFHGIVHIRYIRPAYEFNPIGTSLFWIQASSARKTHQANSRSGDIMVVVEANHTCMISREIEKLGSNTTTIDRLGQFSTDPATWSVFLQNIPNNTTSGT
ncbi:hypothetical protein Gotri_012232, partial [Gossypium trilobum]|nr:hypothetical protein [Gossypium trilobum]